MNSIMNDSVCLVLQTKNVSFFFLSGRFIQFP